MLGQCCLQCLKYNKNYHFEMDKLLCILCRSSYKNPKMCSNCSQIYCEGCIQTYLLKYHACPTCNHILPNLADCTRLIAQLKLHVKMSCDRKFKNCVVHDLPLKYHCVDCSQYICSDCGVIEQKHRGHNLQPRGIINKQFPKAKLRQYLVSVEEYILKDHSRHQQLVLERQVLKSELRWSKNRLKEYYQQMNLKLEQEAYKLMSQIGVSIQEKDSRMHKLKKVKEDIVEVLQFQETHSNLPQQTNRIFEILQLDNEDQIFCKLEALIEEYKESFSFNFNRKSLATLNKVYPEYINQTFEFNYQNEQFLHVKYSDSFFIYGQQWRLKIYPSGNGYSEEHLSLFLELIDAPNPIGSSFKSNEYYFRLELISLNTAGKTISKQYRSPFVIGDCWGYNDFVKLQQLPEYLNNGHLIFVVGIRYCSYYDVCQNMRKYIKKMESERKVLEQIINSQNMGSEINPSHSVLNTSRNISSSRIISDESNIIDSD